MVFRGKSSSAITANLGGNFASVIMAANKAWTASLAGDSPAASVSVVSKQATPPARHGGGRGGGRGGCQRGSRVGTVGQMTTLTLCSFHKKFGDAARKCAQGCSRWNE